MARRRFFAEEIHHGHAVITGDEAQHLRQVLRAERGQRYEVSDGNRVFLGEIEDLRKAEVRFRILDEIAQTPPALHLSLGAALIKFDRLETLIEKATELGVQRVLPFAAIRSEKGLEKAVPKRLERWQRIALEAAKQSHRVAPPDIVELQSLQNILDQPAGLRLFLDEAGGVPVLDAMPPLTEREVGASGILLVGPEGGWDPREREEVLAAGFQSVSLGPRILRAETAAMAALAAIQFCWDQRGAARIDDALSEVS